MDKAEGESCSEFQKMLEMEKYKDFKVVVKPEVQRKLTNLQILDTIAGQIDRNTENYFLTWNENKATKTITVTNVKGIDNDL